MLTIKRLRNLADKENKKLSKKSIEKINFILEDTIKEIIKKAAKNADFKGRKIIKEKDIE